MADNLTKDGVIAHLKEKNVPIVSGSGSGVLVDQTYPRIGENGNVQMVILNNGSRCTITMPSDVFYNGGTTDTRNVVINGTWDSLAYADATINDSYVNNNNKESNRYDVVYFSTSSYNEGINNVVSNVESSLGIKRPGYSMIGGASAAAIKNENDSCDILAEANKAMKNGEYFDVATYDAAGINGNFAGPFADDFLSEDNKELREYMKENGSFIYGYEAMGGRTLTPDKAFPNFMRIAQGNEGEGTNNVIFAFNPKLNEHSITVACKDKMDKAVSPEYFAIDNTLNSMARGDFKDISIAYVTGAKDENGDLIEFTSDTKYYNLNSEAFLSGRYYYDTSVQDIYATDENGNILLDENGNKISLALSVEELSRLIDGTRDFSVVKSFMDGTLQLKEIKFLNVKEYESQGSSAGKMAVTYNSVAALANSIVYAANATRCKDQPLTSFGNSNADFLTSLNTAHSTMFGITGRLMDTLSTDINNIAQLLENYKTLETSLLSDTEKLNHANLGVVPSGSLDLSKINFNDLSRINCGYYDTVVAQGGAGKFSLDNIDYLLSSNSMLTKGLTNEIEDANRLKSTIENMMHSPYAVGDGWDEVYKHLEDYVTICNYRIEAANALMDAEKSAFELIRDYMVNTPPPLDCDVDEYDRAYIDDGEIGEVEAHMQRLKVDITTAEAKKTMIEYENSQLSKIQYREWQECSKDSQGNTWCEYHSNAAEYNAAQARIASNNTLIADLEAQLEIARHTLDIATQQLNKLTGLAGIITDANKIVSSALGVVNSKYGGLVDSMPNIVVQPLTF